MGELAFAGTDGIIILSAFAVIMLIIGYLSGRGEKNIHESLSGYYLAGKNLGIIALFFTLFATQYSGNTIVGYAPTAYRTGFSWLQSISFMTIIIGSIYYSPPGCMSLRRSGILLRLLTGWTTVLTPKELRSWPFSLCYGD
jgi:hypothetical protein